MHADLEASLLVLAGSVAVDLLLGEYPRLLHPVVWLGKLIWAMLLLAPRHGWRRQLAFGIFLAAGVCSSSAALVWLLLDLSAAIPLVHLAVGIFFLKSAIALRALGEAGKRVWVSVEQGKLEQARAALSSLCSRDPAGLDPEELLQATIESLAENASDSWVAPLFYFVLFGIPGAIAYRAINTLDAMVGYRGKYEALGKASARLDDVANWVPARLTALLLLLCGFLLGKDTAGGWRILRRDGGKTPSPNAGRPMAVMAGLLGIRLEKKGIYVLGDPLWPATPAQARLAWRIVACSGLVMILLSAGGIFLSISVYALALTSAGNS
jgi:adenosylcobinamide-phosphate synthase